MKIVVPYEIGDKIVVSGKTKIVRGVHVFVRETGTVSKWRIHTGDGEFISIPNDDKRKEGS